MVIDLLHYLLMMRRDIWLNLQSKKESKKEQRQKRKIKVPSHHRKSSFYAQSLSWCFESPIRTELNFPISLWPLIDHLPSASIRAWCRGCAFIAYALLGSVGSKWTLDKLRCWIITATRFHYPPSESHALFIQSNNGNVFLLGIKSISDVIYKGKKSFSIIKKQGQFAMGITGRSLCTHWIKPLLHCLFMGSNTGLYLLFSILNLKGTA